jgi:hypothetical protein
MTGGFVIGAGLLPVSSRRWIPHTAVARLAAMHRRPVFLVEDWEAADPLKRLPAASIARLDWPPRADVGTAVHVLLFDPADRGQPPDRVPTDRFR